MHDQKHYPTVFVCGGTGVGKSTLVNALGGELAARTATGSPVTQRTDRFTFADVELSIYDSKGLEIDASGQAYLRLLSDIVRLRFCAPATEQIDIVLMCIQEPQNRIDQAHRDIASLCDDLNLPFGIALTKTLGNPDLAAKVSECFPEAKFIQRVRTLGIELVGGTIIPPEGVDSLRDHLRTFAVRDEAAATLRARNAAFVAHFAQTANTINFQESARTKILNVARRNRTGPRVNDFAWIEYAQLSGRLIGIKSREWKRLLSTMRTKQMTRMVPERLSRVLRAFDCTAIDSANARGILPFILRRFADDTRSLQPADIDQAVQAAAVSLERNKPYRWRFKR
jgi:hypothetical protein